MNKVTIAIHAGAGNFNIQKANQQELAQHLQTLQQIVQAGYQALQKGASALDVVEEAVIALENYPGFNAGRGSALTSAGTVEMDAAIMDGTNRKAGAVAVVKRVKNPISGARAVMSHSNHVMMVCEGADEFCAQQHLAMEDNNYFITEPRRKQLQQTKTLNQVQDIDSLGTVGAVARDIHGHLAAATSTGGKANQLPGRVGDSPIIGAGTWADDQTCAISGTGDGEIFIRTCFAHSIHAQMLWKNTDLKTACNTALENVAKFKSEGGCIAIDRDGKLIILFNTTGMFRGWIDENGNSHAAVQK